MNYQCETVLSEGYDETLLADEVPVSTFEETVISPCLAINLGEYYSLIETFYEFPYICAEVYTNLILETAPRRYYVVDLKSIGFDYSEYMEEYDDCPGYVCGKIVPDDSEEETLEHRRSIFFIIDSSGGMSGYRIYGINQIFRKLTDILKEPEENRGDKKYMISVLEYSSVVRWMYDEPVDADEFVWKDIETGGVVSLGQAFSELDDRLSPDEFMIPSSQDRLCIVLLSYRQPTDEHFNRLQELNKNLWFKDAEKYAFAMSNDVDLDLLTMFTGDKEHVFETNDNEILEEKLTDIVRQFKQADSSGAVHLPGGVNTPDKCTASFCYVRTICLPLPGLCI